MCVGCCCLYFVLCMHLNNFLFADAYHHYSSVVPSLMNGDTELLQKLVTQHAAHLVEFNNLRSRYVGT